MLDSFSDKPKLNRTNLEKQGVFYLDEIVFASSDHAAFDKVDKASLGVFTRIRKYLGRSCPGWNYSNYRWQIPPHVDWLREHLLDCTCLIPKSATDSLLLDEERLAIPEHAVFHDKNSKLLSNLDREEQLDVFRDIFKTCRKISELACQNKQDRVKEGDWQYFMEHYIFKRYRGGAKSIFDRYGTDSRPVSEANTLNSDPRKTNCSTRMPREFHLVALSHSALTG
jgi:hypothetical protein